MGCRGAAATALAEPRSGGVDPEECTTKPRDQRCRGVVPTGQQFWMDPCEPDVCCRSSGRGRRGGVRGGRRGPRGAGRSSGRSSRFHGVTLLRNARNRQWQAQLWAGNGRVRSYVTTVPRSCFEAWWLSDHGPLHVIGRTQRLLPAVAGPAVGWQRPGALVVPCAEALRNCVIKAPTWFFLAVRGASSSLHTGTSSPGVCAPCSWAVQLSSLGSPCRECSPCHQCQSLTTHRY